jgi:hypothetical protein
MSSGEGNPRDRGVMGRKGQREPLVLQRAAMARRADALFKAMSTDFLLREQFITDPAQITSEYLYGTSLPPQKASVSNQILFSVMSNPKLLGWLRDYAVKHSADPPSRDAFAREFGRAVVEFGGYHVVLALFRNSVEKEDAVAFDEALLPIIYAIFTGGGFASGTEMSTGTFATEQSGTHMSTGGLVAGTEMSTGTFATEQSGTHMSTGGLVAGTEMSTGTFATEQSGTHMSTGGLVAGTEMSTGTFATEQSGTHMSTGGLVAGTEMSTGTFATEQSGTHMSTGHRPDPGRGLFGSRYALVTLESLVLYATQLRDAGALDVVWGD